MKPLIVLVAVFAVAIVVLRVVNGQFEFAFAARVGMASMLVFTAIGHFTFTNGMAMMIPPVIPFKKFMVYLTGVFEIVAAVGLSLSQYYRMTGWVLIGFFIIMLPANIYAAVKNVNYEKGTYDGPGLKYLWFRVPLQILFIGWVYVAAILN